jgi:uncharacterized protein
MDTLFETHSTILAHLKSDFERSLMTKLPWVERAIMLYGARGSGKTTLLLQHIKSMYDKNECLYITLDDIYFREHTLVDTAKQFWNQGGKVLVLDEVHKYEEWSREVKNIYDMMPTLKLIITGSSILEMEKSGADLSRRLLYFHLPELSFREFMGIKYKKQLPIVSLDDILTNHQELTKHFVELMEKPLKYFKEYLTWGAYPIFTETKWVHARLKQTINIIIESDLPSVIPIEYKSLNQIKRLLYIIAQSVPFTPNITKLAEQIGCTRNKLYEMIHILMSAKLIYGLYNSGENISTLSKPEKIYLHNSNLLYALSEKEPEIGTVREMFFINMLESHGHKVRYTKKGDFLIDEKLTFEVGGRNKSNKQIQDVASSYIAKDEIEFGYDKSIPLWLFGMMY